VRPCNRPGGSRIRFAVLTAALALLIVAPARAGTNSVPQPALIAQISRQVFGQRWRAAACIAHYESTDGAHLVNGSNLGPWQSSAYWHPWIDRRRILVDWVYAARVAYRVSDGGRDWSAWPNTHRLCGV